MTRSLFRGFFAVISAAGVFAGVARAQTNSHWATGVSDNWNNPARWTTNPFYPDNGNGAPTYNAFIDPAGSPPGTPYTVSLNLPITINNFEISSPDATLDLLNSLLMLEGTYLQQNSRVTTSGTGTIQAAGAATFRGATMQGVSSFTSQSTLTFDGSALNTINASTINQTGTTASWTGTGNIQFGGSTVFQHGATSTFTISNDQTLAWDNAGTRPVFNNAGTLVKSGGTGVTFFDGVTLNNTGTLRVDSGTIRANNTSVTNTAGTISIANTSVLQTTASASFTDTGGTINGNGGGALRTAGATTFQGTTLLRLGVQSSGSLTFSGAAPLDMCDSDIDHSGMSCMWSGGGDIRMENGTSQRHFLNGASSTFSIMNDRSIIWNNIGMQPVFNNQGTLQKNSTSGVTAFTGVMLNNTGTLSVSTGTVSANSVVNVSNVTHTLTGGTWNITGAATLDFSTQTVQHNAAIVTLSGPGSAFAALTSNIQSNDAGGQLTFQNGRNYTTPGNFTNNGILKVISQTAPTTFSVAPGFTLTNYNTITRTLSGGSFLVDGSGRISGGIEFDGADIATLDAGIDLLGSGAGIFNSAAGGADALANLDTIANSGQFHIAFDHNFQTLHDFTVAPTGALTISDTTVFSVAPGFGLTNFDHNGNTGLFEDGNFNVQGTLIADNAHVVMLNNTTVLDGPDVHIQNRDGGNNNAFSTLSHILSNGHLTLSGGQMLTLNPGTLTTDAGSSLQVGPVASLPGDTRLIIQGDFHQNGSLALGQGEVDVHGSHFASGPIIGSGTIRILPPGGGGSMINGARIAPGGVPDSSGQVSPFGNITLDGDMRLLSAAVIDIEISAATPSIPGVTFDRLDILGELFFGGGPTGTLRVTLLGDLPALGTEFVIITYNQHDAGGFADIQGLDLGNGFFFEPHFDPQSFSVVLVPAPGAAAGLILTAGLAGISRRRRAA